MYDEIDKKLNQSSGFKHIPTNATRQVRLLRVHDFCIQRGEAKQKTLYSLEVVSISELPSIRYKALSHTWGFSDTVGDVREIQIDSQAFFIRRNLHDFLGMVVARGECGLFFIDAICIDQLDNAERQSQVREMPGFYNNADEVIAWLGYPDRGSLRNVQALCRAKGRDCVVWTPEQWAGFRYLSYHSFWSRGWVVQEVLLASRMRVWCGPFAFPLSIFRSSASNSSSFRTACGKTSKPENIRSTSFCSRSPAELIVTHRLRHVPRPVRDPLAQGTMVGTMEEMKRELRGPTTVMETYQSRTPDLLSQVMRRFGKLHFSDPCDKLYGFLGLLHERSRSRIMPNYSKGVDHAFYQALKLGLEELCMEQDDAESRYYGEQERGIYSRFYCDVRDAFDMEDDIATTILRKVLVEFRFNTRREHGARNIANTQLFREFKHVIGFSSWFMDIEKGEAQPESIMSRKQRRLAENVLCWFRKQSQRCRLWASPNSLTQNLDGYSSDSDSQCSKTKRAKFSLSSELSINSCGSVSCTETDDTLVDA